MSYVAQEQRRHAFFYLIATATILSRAIWGDRRMPSTGFAEPAPGNDIFIGYSTSTGKVAEDGGGLLSPFAVAFLKRVEENEDLAAMFKKITLDVNRATDGWQTPAFHDSLATAIFLRAAP